MFTTLILLAVVGAIEAWVYQKRYASTFGKQIAVAGWTVAVCILRTAFVALGVSAVLKDNIFAAVVVYSVSAGIVTYIVRTIELAKERKLFEAF